MKKLLFLLLISGCKCDPCFKGHYEIVHHEAWTQYIYISNSNPMQPIYFSEYDSNDFICDETESEHKLREMRKK